MPQQQQQQGQQQGGKGQQQQQQEGQQEQQSKRRGLLRRMWDRWGWTGLIVYFTLLAAGYPVGALLLYLEVVRVEHVERLLDFIGAAPDFIDLERLRAANHSPLGYLISSVIVNELLEPLRLLLTFLVASFIVRRRNPAAAVATVTQSLKAK
eukprot:GHVU01202390.1.p2 GENE.GHVU01202390.1~~GHVU01202390.1.p2  ORF type:complete len:152 (-),score=39.33 GHVU01202390.1:125-580(-)